ncbi:hypothetical protein B7759_04569 [Burkholderia glumae]|nr:hypothetical protein KS03_5058 [Burkholderia glumae LMG 2196 = ATCC 33617]QKM56923.1 hypothetical protein CG017_04991 [Burkholderia glumae]QTP35935.1 hypothetical protein B7759_04569 [Burkholderia glumae]
MACEMACDKDCNTGCNMCCDRVGAAASGEAFGHVCGKASGAASRAPRLRKKAPAWRRGEGNNHHMDDMKRSVAAYFRRPSPQATAASAGRQVRR